MNACMGKSACRKQQLDDQQAMKNARLVRRQKKGGGGGRKPITNLAAQMNLSEDLDNDDSFQLLDVEDAQISNNTNMDTT